LTSGGQEVFTAHSQGVINLIKVVNWAGLKAFVQVGSSDEYGNAEAPQKESLREAPISPYSLGKTCATHFIQMLARTENFPGVVLRLFLVYGPGQNKNRFLPAIIEHCLNDREFAASEGRQLRDFCYVEDIVKGMLLAAVTEAAFGKVINLASGVPISIRKVIEMAMNLIKGGHPLFGEHPYRPGENMALYADISLAKTLLGWRPEVSLEDGLKKTIASMTGDVN
jgi:nucleoside-diphosphate-sugar epimerase